MNRRRRFYGKYRGVVASNVDPMLIGRIQAIVPDVYGNAPTNWAMPCFPLAGLQAGVWAVPAVGSSVWVEFERGHPDYPVWTGCFYNSAAEVPAPAMAVPAALSAIILQTQQQNGLSISDDPGPNGGLVLSNAAGASVIVNATGIHIRNGKGASVVLEGPTVTINGKPVT